MTTKLTDEELARLTDEEREAINEPDAPEGDDPDNPEADATDADAEAVAAAAAAKAAAAGKDADGDKGDDKDADAGEPGDKDADAVAAAAAKAKEDEAAAAAVAAAADADDKGDKGDEVDADEKAVIEALPTYKPPEDAKPAITALKEKQTALAKEFDDGDLSASEYQAKLDEIYEERRGIENKQLKAEIAKENRETAWNGAVEAFLKDNDQYSKGTANGILDREVRRLQVAAEDAGRDPLHPSILEAAHAAILETAAALVGKTAEPAAADAGAADKKPGAKTALKKRPAAPPTLAKVPAADISEVNDGKYDELDKLQDSDADAFHAALAKMPEAERNRYMATSN
jgi:hypothetical protein